MSFNRAHFLWQVAALSGCLLVGALRVSAEPLNWWSFNVRDELPAPQNVTALCATRDGHVWCGTWGGGVMRFDGIGWRVYRRRAGELSDDFVQALHERPQQRELWFATQRGVSVYSFKRDEWVTQDYPLLNRLTSYEVTDIAEQPRDVLWFATAAHGIFRYDLIRNTWQQLPRQSGDLDKDSVFKLFAQSNGALWIGYNGKGVSVREPNGTIKRLPDIARGRVIDICEWSDGSVWFAISSQGSICVFDDKQPAEKRWTWRDLRHLAPEGTQRVYLYAMMEAPNGDRWLATNGQGVLVLDRYGNPRTTWTRQNSGLASNRVVALCRRPDDTLWFGTFFGISVYSANMLREAPEQMFPPERARSDMLKSTPLPPTMTRADISAVVKGKDGTDWFGTRNGLVRRRGGQWRTFTVGNTSGGLPISDVYSLAMLDGRLVVGTRVGMAFYDERANVWSTLTAQDGLPDGVCDRLDVSQRGRLCVKTIAPSKQHCLTLPEPPETYLVIDKTVCTQSRKGTRSVYRLQSLPSPMTQTIAGRTLLAASLPEQVVKSRHLTVRAFAVSPWRSASSEKFQYQFELDGKRSAWQREPVYTFDLTNGSYVVRVRACDRFLNIDPTAAELSIRARIPLPNWIFWMTGSGCALLLCVLLFGIVTHRQRVERIRLKRELEMGHDMQERFLPNREVQYGDYDIVSRYLPAKEVGGDFYNVFPLGDDKIGLVIGDVSGKGVEGAMFMPVAMSVVEVIGCETHLSPAVVLRQANSHLYPKLQPQYMMVTLFYGVLDIQAHVLTFANAGQHYPLLCQEGRSEELKYPGMPLGKILNPFYEDHTIQIAPHGTLVLCSDGFVDIIGRDGEVLGFERFYEMVRNHSHLSATQMVGRLLDAALRFANGHEERDDLTLVIVKRTEGGKDDVSEKDSPHFDRGR
jgi:ligand-binding sensor domain-containing protein